MSFYHHKIESLGKNSPGFPPILKEISPCPSRLFVKGNKELLKDSFLKIAIVGTRKATSPGLFLAEQFSKRLSEKNITIVSGLALGIDQAAHWGCLKARGKTIAVLARGLDSVYPAQHEALADKILENGGLLISEYPLGSPILPHCFLERNRIVSGLSKGVVIIEAPANSGALSTAAHAIEQNREVFVVPGAINNKNYEGSNSLIKQGAHLISSANDVLEALNLPRETGTLPLINLNQEQQLIYDTLRLHGNNLIIDKIIELTKLQPHVVNQTIAFMVINDIIQEGGSHYFLK